MTQPSHRFRFLLFSKEENDRKAFDLINELESLLEMTNYKVDQCIYLHPGHSCTQCSVVRLMDEMWHLGYWSSNANRAANPSYFLDETETFITLVDISDTMAKVSEKVRATWRKEGQFFPDESLIVNDLVLEV